PRPPRSTLFPYTTLFRSRNCRRSTSVMAEPVRVRIAANEGVTKLTPSVGAKRLRPEGTVRDLCDRHAAVEFAMAKTSSRTKKGLATKLDAPEKLKIDLTRFKSDLTANDLKNALTPVRFA